MAVADSLAGLPFEGCCGACFYEHTAISGESTCEEVHPYRVMIYSNSHVLGYGLLGELMLFIDNLMVTLKRLKTSVSTVDGTLVGDGSGSMVEY